jgi:hypothetical protein
MRVYRCGAASPPPRLHRAGPNGGGPRDRTAPSMANLLSTVTESGYMRILDPRGAPTARPARLRRPASSGPPAAVRRSPRRAASRGRGRRRRSAEAGLGWHTGGKMARAGGAREARGGPGAGGRRTRPGSRHGGLGRLAGGPGAGTPPRGSGEWAALLASVPRGPRPRPGAGSDPFRPPPGPAAATGRPGGRPISEARRGASGRGLQRLARAPRPSHSIPDALGDAAAPGHLRPGSESQSQSPGAFCSRGGGGGPVALGPRPGPPRSESGSGR